MARRIETVAYDAVQRDFAALDRQAQGAAR
jgi:hypothetical protein